MISMEFLHNTLTEKNSMIQYIVYEKMCHEKALSGVRNEDY